jgi:hypothetical protein
MALEHNLIYFSTRAKAAQEVSAIETEKKTVAFPIATVANIITIRQKADKMGLSLPVLLRRMHDPDDIHNVVDANKHAFLTEKANTNKLLDSIKQIKAESAERGGKAPLIATDYYTIIYASYIKHLNELETLRLAQIKGVKPNE